MNMVASVREVAAVAMGHSLRMTGCAGVWEQEPRMVPKALDLCS